MNNNTKIILSAVIAAAVVSLLFLAVPVTGSFIVSYIFALAAIAGIALSLSVFGGKNNKAPQGFAYIHTAVVYAVVSTIVSVIACIVNYFIPFSVVITLVLHIAILAGFVIRAIAISSGNEYIVKTDEQAEEKHKEFQKEKATYWD